MRRGNRIIGSACRSARRTRARRASRCRSGSTATSGSRWIDSTTSPASSHGQAHEADLNAPVAQRLDLLAGQQRVQLDLDAREARAPDAQHARQDVEVGGRHEADRQLTDLAAARALRGAHRALASARARRRASARNAWPAGVSSTRRLRAVEQRDAQLLLELPDLLAERRLRDVQARRGPAEVQLLGDRHEVA